MRASESLPLEAGPALRQRGKPPWRNAWYSLMGRTTQPLPAVTPDGPVVWAKHAAAASTMNTRQAAGSLNQGLELLSLELFGS